MIVIHIKTQELIILDPLRQKTNREERSTQLCIALGENLMKKKFNCSSLKVIDMTHTLQRDGYNCGVFVAYYGHQIVHGKFVFETT